MPFLDDAERARVDAIARSFIGTPFHDHGEVKGAGVDCATLLKCVATEAEVVAPFKLDHYSPQFFLHQTAERYIAWVEKFAREIPPDQVKTADIALYRIKGGLCFAHGALITAPGWPNIIHAHFASRCVRRDNGLNPHLGSPVTATKFYSLWRD